MSENKLKEIKPGMVSHSKTEEELPAVEVLAITSQICNYTENCDLCKFCLPMRKCMIVPSMLENNSRQVVEICRRWKADHEKKAPEVEWVWKAYAVGEDDDFVSPREGDVIEWCQSYVKAHPDRHCTYKFVCRAKA